MTVEIVEILRRSEQGMTRPFICRGDDDEIYFVKGIGAGRRSQICEWIAGRLGIELGLPIAPFEIVQVPEELLEIGMDLELDELGAGPAFGSREQRVTELTVAVVDEVPDWLQQDVLIFDRWIRNGDRNLTEKGGNPNLFWQPNTRELMMIDHNQAFDLDASKKELFEYHVFRDQAREIGSDFFRRDEYNEKLSKALESWPDILATIPDQWRYADPEQTVPVDFDLDRAYELLKAHVRDDFWS